VEVGKAGARGFTAEISVAARDASGAALARGHTTFSGEGNACNFFSLPTTSAFVPDGGADARGDGRGDGRRDASADVRRDASADVRRTDSPVWDQRRPPDASADMPPIDAKPGADRMPKEAKPVFDVWPASPPCAYIEAAGTRHWNPSAGALAVCSYNVAAIDQAKAAAICGATWSLCTPSQYGLHFPYPQPAPDPKFQNAWLAACVVEAAMPVYKEAVCTGGCSLGPAYTPSTVSVCPSGSGPATTTYSTVGLVSASTCIAVGFAANDAGTKKAGWWGLQDKCSMAAPAPFNALCCHP